MDFDDLSGLNLDPDCGVLPDDWDDVAEEEIADLRRRVTSEAAERV